MDRSKTIYQAWTVTYQGENFVYEGNDEEQFKAAVAKLEAENERVRTDKRLWWSNPKEIFTAIIEPVAKTEESDVEPVQKMEEQEQVEESAQENAYERISEPTFEIAERGKFEVFVEIGAEPAKIIYRGDSARAAKEAVASRKSHPLLIRAYTKFEGRLAEYGGNNEWYWNGLTWQGRHAKADAYLQR